MKTGVLVLLDTLDLGGAENLAANIAINLKRANLYNPVFCLTRTGGELEKRLSEHDIKHVILGRAHRYELHKFYKVRKIIKDENIKLIHAHKPGSNFWAGIIGGFFGIPVISHFHTHPRQLGEFGGNVLSKIVCSMSKRVICISNHVRQDLLREQGIDPAKLVTIHNGIKYEDYIKKSKPGLKTNLGISPDSKVIALVAGFREEKNHSMLLLSAKEVLDRETDATFLFVGDGSLREDIESRAAELGIRQRCIFTGIRNDIPDILSIIDMGILCSHWEGIPLVVLEYMAASKPVISTDIKGIEEIIEDGINGALVPPDDFKSLAEAIIGLLGNSALSRTLADNGFQTVKENFSEEKMMREIESLYKEVISNNV